MRCPSKIILAKKIIEHEREDSNSYSHFSVLKIDLNKVITYRVYVNIFSWYTMATTMCQTLALRIFSVAIPHFFRQSQTSRARMVQCRKNARKNKTCFALAVQNLIISQ